MFGYTTQMLINALRSWNLKYDEFPEIMQEDNVVLVAFGRNLTVQMDFVNSHEAANAINLFGKAMAERANNYWRA
jgi:hypothetical protein